jgi:hypothetical protein
VAIVLKSGSFKLLEPSGPVQACNGIALPFAFSVILYSTEHIAFSAEYTLSTTIAILI